MKLDFLIPASPDPTFYSQIAMFRLALDRLGGPYRDARLVAVFGAEVRSSMPRRWQPHFARIETAWADAAEFARFGYGAQGDRRFELIRPDADLAILCDADTLLLRSFSRDVLRLGPRKGLGGVIAHYHFPWGQSSGNRVTDWQLISKEVLGREIETPFAYTLAEGNAAKACPFYINLGFLVGSPGTLRLLYERFRIIRPKVRDILNNHFDAQVAFALALSEQNIAAAALPMRYNFPNDPIADRRYAFDRWTIVLLHYLRAEAFDRHLIFQDRDNFHRFMDMRLEGSNRIFQKFVAKLTRGRYPFDADGPN